MLYSIVIYLMQLSMLYLLIATFIIMDLLLLSIRVRRLQEQKLVRKRHDAARITEQRRERNMFERRHIQMVAAAE